MWRSAINVKGLHQTYISQEGSSIHYPALCRLLSGVWISLGPFPRQQGTKGIYSFALTTLLNGLKPYLWWISEIWTSKSLFGKTLSLGSGSLTPSSRTMVFSSIVKPSGDTIANWELRIDILPQPTPRGMGKPAVNKVIMNGLKKRLDDVKGRWVEELLHVLCYRTTPHRSTGETPFLMTYGAEAVIPL